jgi:hypothetical protein
MMKRRLSTICLAWIPVAAVAADVQDYFTPARFGMAHDSLLQIMQCPATRATEDIVVIYCLVHVGADGRQARRYCFAHQDGTDAYRRAALSAIQDAAFVPATVAGQPTPVAFWFRLAFQHEAAECRTFAIPNLGFQRDLFGDAYVAPQEILTNGPWWTRMRRLNPPTYAGGWGGLKGFAMIMSVAVDVDGNASGRRIDRNNLYPRRQASESARALELGTFIPGFVGGKPEPMRHYFPVHFGG